MSRTELTTNPAPLSSLSPLPILHAERLEIQTIRYRMLELSDSRPADLNFIRSSLITNGQALAPYVYQGVFNQAPYELIICPANSLFLSAETQLHAWAQRLRELRHVHADHNFQLHVQSVEKDVVKRLNALFKWKREIYITKYLSAASDNPVVVERPLVDTARYLQAYDVANASRYSLFILAGMLLVLVLHLLFHNSQGYCEVVLGLLHDQVALLEELIDEGRRQELARSIPRTVKTVLSAFDLDPCVSRFVVCRRCFGLVPSTDDFPEFCPHREITSPNPCNGRLSRTDKDGNRRPIKEYVHQDFREWLGRFLCRQDVEEMLDRRKRQFKDASGRTDGLVDDILGSKMIQGFLWPDGLSFTNCPDDDLRLFFALSGDGFNPFFNRTAKQSVTSTGLYLFCLNLPLEERQKPENVYLAGVIPGPDKPSTSQINHYISIIVDQFLPFWKTGVRYSRTCKRPAGVLSRAALMPVLCDTLGARQICGYGSPQSNFFCTFCWLAKSDLENFRKEKWPQRNLNLHRFWAEQWNRADPVAQANLFQEHGVRYTPLLRLPYFDPIQFTVLDTMHNFFLGLLERHCRDIWGMDLEAVDGDGSLKPYGTKDPPQVSAHKLQIARQALEFKDVKRLASSSRSVLIYLCIENDLRRGRGKKNLVRELLQWRKKQGAFMPSAWHRNPALDDEPTPAISKTYVLSSSGPLNPPPAGSSAQVDEALFSSQESSVSLPSSISKEKLEDAEDALVRGLKLDGITRPVLAALCADRSIHLRNGAIKQEMVAALNEWRARQVAEGNIEQGRKKKIKKKKGDPGSVVLGRTVLAAASLDIENMVLPKWVDPAPIGVGQKKRGKLSADQWRSFCTIHLVFTLIRLWGREPEGSRWYSMLTNFLDLVQAVETGSMLVTSADHRNAYNLLMTRYLVRMKELYKEALIVPNHHLALHVPDYLELWGPSPHTRGFGWERFNFDLQQIKSNKRFGDIEKSYLYTSARKANLIALLALEKIKAAVSNMYARLQKVLHPDARGTRLYDIFNDSSNQARRVPKNQVNLPPLALESLATLLNNEEGSEITYVPTHTQLAVPPGHLFLHPLVGILPSLKQKGTVYRSFSRAPRDSNILLRSESGSGMPYHPARLEEIFTHKRQSRGKEVVSEVFCVVRLLQALPEELIEKDWFRSFGLVGGSLWSSIHDDQSRIIRPSLIVCHYASSIMQASETGFGFVTTHVLPLDRLKTYIESSGERVVDTYEDVEGIFLEDDDPAYEIEEAEGAVDMIEIESG
ncbi:hypothetical protein MD484_g8588, partial [Candolleomyces efflorescens]